VDLWIINGLYHSTTNSPTSSIELIESEHTLFLSMLLEPLEVIQYILTYYGQACQLVDVFNVYGVFFFQPQNFIMDSTD